MNEWIRTLEIETVRWRGACCKRSGRGHSSHRLSDTKEHMQRTMCMVQVPSLLRQPKQRPKKKNVFTKKKKKLTERIASGLGMEKCVRKRETLSRRTEQRKTFEANFRPFSLSLCLLATFFFGALTCSLECNIFDAGLFFPHCARLHQTHKSLHRNHNPFFAFPDASHHILPLNLILLRSAHARSLSTLPSTKFSTLFPLLAPFLSF